MEKRIDYKKLYEKQWEVMIDKPMSNCLGFRNLLRKYDWDRSYIANRLIDHRKRILDIGCANGHLLFILEDRFEELYGIDVSPSKIQEAKVKAKQLFSSKYAKFKFTEKNADEMFEYPDNFFDVVTCIASIEHIYDIFGLVREINRVLKPGGYVVAEVPNIAYLKFRFHLLLGKLPVTSSPYNWMEIGWDGGHIHYFTMKSFCRLFESNGFQIEIKSGSGFLAKFRNWRPSLLTGDLIVKAMKL